MSLAFTPSAGFLWVWGLYLIVATLLVLGVIAPLLLKLISTCVKLLTHARVADVAAVPVRRNVEPVPQLADTLAVIREVLSVAKVVERHGADLEKVLVRELPPEMVRR